MPSRLLLALSLIVCTCSQPLPGSRPLIIGHRGAPCLEPEETIASFQRAVHDGADYIEMDAVSSRDGVLVARHDLTLDSNTNVAQRPEFAGRRRTAVLPDGTNKTGFFVSDFTRTELATLWATQPFPFRSQAHNMQHRIATIDEALHFARPAMEAGQLQGVYIETKAPTFHVQQGLPLEGKLVDLLAAAGWAELGEGAAILESFERQSLQQLHSLLDEAGLGRTPLVWLLPCSANVTEDELAAFSTYGWGIGPDKTALVPVVPTEECVLPANATCGAIGKYCNGQLQSPLLHGLHGASSASSALVATAHRHGLRVHSYTHRNEGMFMPLDFAADPAAELSYYANIAVDGVFTDCPATAAAWWREASSYPGQQASEVPRSTASRLKAFMALLVTVLISAPLLCIAWAWWQRRRQGVPYQGLYDLPSSASFPMPDEHTVMGLQLSEQTRQPPAGHAFANGH